MELGQVIDYVYEYNDLHGYSKKQSGGKEEKEEPQIRKATQADWDAFWG